MYLEIVSYQILRNKFQIKIELVSFKTFSIKQFTNIKWKS